MENMLDYIQNKLPDDISEFAGSERLKTGYANLDSITDIHPGLYVLGAVPSLGKTTFLHQMADNWAKEGVRVLYFSLEMSLLELASKSLSRLTWKSDVSTALSSIEIRNNANPEVIRTAIGEYSKYAENLSVVEGNFASSMDDIEGHIKEYIKNNNNKKPVVIIDYLQIIASDKMSSKEAVDTHIRKLKQLQVENKLVMIVISSFNRANYMTEIDYESFKETGGIEYTADVIWGLQLQVIHEDIFNQQSKINEKRELIRDAKAAFPRKVELVCLKNRFGVSSYSCNFDYYPKYDFFEADTPWQIDSNGTSKELTYGEQIELNELFNSTNI